MLVFVVHIKVTKVLQTLPSWVLRLGVFLELDDLFHKFGLEGLFLYSGFRSFDTINLNLYNL